MIYTLEQKYQKIKEEIKFSLSTNPIEIVQLYMNKDYVNIHGPEHHFLDGAAFLVAYNNVTNSLDIEAALNKLAERSVKMPGAMCGYWGVCGSVTSIGAALSIIHETGPLSKEDYYKDHMEYTSRVIDKMSKIGGPRCCKRNAFLALKEVVLFVKEKYQIEMELDQITCYYSKLNKECIKEKCPFWDKKQ